MYRTTGKSHSKIIMWSAPLSAYSGKMRAYLTKAGIDFEERYPVDPRYPAEIMPQIGYYVVPVLEMPDGTLMQDTSDAFLQLEKLPGVTSLIPPTPVQRALSSLINFFGTDAFLKPGMHYRWSVIDQQRHWLETSFLDFVPGTMNREESRSLADKIMTFYNAYCPELGISAETIPAIEESWLDCMDIMDRHFSVHPYLLGGRPSIGDCGLMTFFYPHLARDPVPATLMKNRAPHLYRWTERMNRTLLGDGGFTHVAPEFHPADEVPETLLPFLEYLFADAGPEVVATIKAFNKMLDTHPELAAGDSLTLPGGPQTAHPPAGYIEYQLRGTPIRRQALVDTVYQHQQVLKEIDALGNASKSRLTALIERTGGEAWLNARPDRPIKYEHYTYRLA